MKQFFSGGLTDTFAGNGTGYFSVQSDSGLQTATAKVTQLISATGWFSDLCISLSNAPGGTASHSFRLICNGSGTDCLLNITGTSITGICTTGATCYPGDKVYFSWIGSGNPASATVAYSIAWYGSVAGESMILGNGRFLAVPSGSDFGSSIAFPINGANPSNCDIGFEYEEEEGWNITSVEFRAKRVIPIGGTITSIIAESTEAPGDEKEFDLVVMKDLDEYVIDAGIYNEDKTGGQIASCPVPAGAHLWMRACSSPGTPSANCFFGISYISNNDGESLLLGGHATGGGAEWYASAWFSHLSDGSTDTKFSSAEGAYKQLGGFQSEVRNLWVSLNDAPSESGSGSFTYELYRNSSPTNLKVVVNGNSTSGVDLDHTVVIPGYTNSLSLHAYSSGTLDHPASAYQATWGTVCNYPVYKRGTTGNIWVDGENFMYIDENRLVREVDKELSAHSPVFLGSGSADEGYSYIICMAYAAGLYWVFKSPDTSGLLPTGNYWYSPDGKEGNWTGVAYDTPPDLVYVACGSDYIHFVYNRTYDDDFIIYQRGLLTSGGTILLGTAWPAFSFYGLTGVTLVPTDLCVTNDNCPVVALYGISGDVTEYSPWVMKSSENDGSWSDDIAHGFPYCLEVEEEDDIVYEVALAPYGASGFYAAWSGPYYPWFHLYYNHWAGRAYDGTAFGDIEIIDTRPGYPCQGYYIELSAGGDNDIFMAYEDDLNAPPYFVWKHLEFKYRSSGGVWGSRRSMSDAMQTWESSDFSLFDDGSGGGIRWWGVAAGGILRYMDKHWSTGSRSWSSWSDPVDLYINSSIWGAGAFSPVYTPRNIEAVSFILVDSSIYSDMAWIVNPNAGKYGGYIWVENDSFRWTSESDVPIKCQVTGSIIIPEIQDQLEDDDYEILSSTGFTRVSEKFNLVHDVNVTSVDLLLKGSSGTPTGTVSVVIRNDDVEPDVLIGVLDSMEASAISSSGYDWYTFSGNVPVSDVSMIKLSLECTGGDASGISVYSRCYWGYYLTVPYACAMCVYDGSYSCYDSLFLTWRNLEWESSGVPGGIYISGNYFCYLDASGCVRTVSGDKIRYW